MTLSLFDGLKPVGQLHPDIFMPGAAGYRCEMSLADGALTITSHDYTRSKSASWPTDDVRYFAFEDAGTKSNIAALVTFGVLGLGARRNWTLLVVGLPEQDAYFLVRQAPYEVRQSFDLAFRDAPELRAKVVEGPPPKSDRREVELADDPLETVEAVERITSLYKEGYLTDDEFHTIKSRLTND